MAYTEWQSATQTLNRARALCDRVIARDAPSWMSQGPLPAYTITAEGHVKAGDEPEPVALTDSEGMFIEGVQTLPEEDYLLDLTEAEKTLVRTIAGGDVERAAYADNLRQWRERTE